MKVSVIVPAYNEEKYIEQCLKHLYQQTEPADEIILVNNNSTDNTVAIAKKFPKIKILHQRKKGIIPTRNKGFNSAKYELILRTDADTEVPKNWIKNIKKQFIDPEVIGFSGPARFKDMPSMREKAYWQGEKLYFQTFRQMFHHEALFGPNMALRKSAWQQIKHDVCLSDKIVHEDIDLAVHLAKIGKIVFNPRIIVLSSSRRWKRFSPHFEYPYRYLRTIQHHKQSLHPLKMGTNFVTKNISFSKSKKLMKTVKSRIQFARSLQKYL